jgi:hypothetical protein
MSTNVDSPRQRDQVFGDPLGGAPGRRATLLGHNAHTSGGPYDVKDEDEAQVDQLITAVWPDALRFARLLNGGAPGTERLVHEAFARWLVERHRSDRPGQHVRRTLIELVTRQRPVTAAASVTASVDFDLWPIGQRAAFILEHIDHYSVAETQELVGDTPVQRRLHDDVFDIHNDVADRLGRTPPTPKDFVAIHQRAERHIAERRRRHRTSTGVVVVLAAVLSLIAMSASHRFNEPTYDRVGDGPMRLMPTWLPPDSNALAPSHATVGGIFQGPFIGLWGRQNNSVVVYSFVGPVDFDGSNNPPSLDEAISRGMQPSGWSSTSVALNWSVGKPVTNSALVLAPKGTSWADVAKIARSVSIETGAPTFRVSELPLGLQERYLGDGKDLRPIDEYDYVDTSATSSPKFSISAVRETPASQEINLMMAGHRTKRTIRGKSGSVFAYTSAGQPTFFSVQVVDGPWTLSANSGSLPVDSLVRILDGMRQVTEAEWADAMGRIEVSSNESLNELRSPKTTVATAESFDQTWVLDAAQLASKDGCLNVRIYSAPVTPRVICVPMNEKSFLMKPTIMRWDGGHAAALIATGPNVTTVISPGGKKLTPNRVVAMQTTDYAAFGLTVVEIPDGQTSITVTVQRIDRAGQRTPTEDSLVIYRQESK